MVAIARDFLTSFSMIHIVVNLSFKKHLENNRQEVTMNEWDDIFSFLSFAFRWKFMIFLELFAIFKFEPITGSEMGKLISGDKDATLCNLLVEEEHEN